MAGPEAIGGGRPEAEKVAEAENYSQIQDDDNRTRVLSPRGEMRGVPNPMYPNILVMYYVSIGGGIRLDCYLRSNPP